MPTETLSCGPVHTMKAGQVYALPAREALVSTQGPVEVSSSPTGPWTPFGQGRTYSEQVIADGATAYWRLDEISGTTVRSLVPGAPDGTIAGDAVLNTTGILADNKAISFNPTGTNGIVTIPVGSYSAIGTGDATIECWHLFPSAPPGSSFPTLITTRAPGTNLVTGLTLFVNAVNGVRFRISTTTAYTESPFVSFTIIPVGVWHHVVGVVRRSTNVIELWTDGVMRSSTAITAGIDLTSISITEIGNHIPVVNEYCRGIIDECAIYKLALTPAQILAHYNTGKGISVLETAVAVPTLEGGFVRSSSDNLFICKFC